MNTPLPRFWLRLLIIALIQSVVLGWMVWDRVNLLSHGQEITLSVQPVDPRDFFRGDYIILRYNISRILVPEVTGDEVFKRRDEIFVGVKSTPQGTWKAVSVQHNLPASQDGVVFIKGRVGSVSRIRTSTGTPNSPQCIGPKCVRLFIKYGMEKYFIPEGDGIKLESLRNEKVLNIVAAVSVTGQAGIKALLVRGKSIYEEPLF